jgi:phage terminase large subunit-like protein
MKQRGAAPEIRLSIGTRDLVEVVHALVLELGPGCQVDVMVGGASPAHASELASLQAAGHISRLRLVVDADWMHRKASAKDGTTIGAQLAAIIGADHLRALRSDVRAVRVQGPERSALILTSAHLTHTRTPESYERADALAPVFKVLVDRVFGALPGGGESTAESYRALLDALDTMRQPAIRVHRSGADIELGDLDDVRDGIYLLQHGGLGVLVPAVLDRVGSPATLWAATGDLSEADIHHLAGEVRGGLKLRLWLDPDVATKGKGEKHAALSVAIPGTYRFARAPKMLVASGPKGTVICTGSANWTGAAGRFDLVRVQVGKDEIAAPAMALLDKMPAGPKVAPPSTRDVTDARRRLERSNRDVDTGPKLPPAVGRWAAALAVADGFTPTPPADDPAEQEDARRELKKRRCLRSLEEFVRTFWPVLNPGTPLVWGRHMTLFCQQLEAITWGRAARITVASLPPGHSKSTIISQCWPVWEWLHFPEKRWLFASHTLANTIRDNERRLTLIQSEEFQGLFQPEQGQSIDGHDALGWTLKKGSIVKGRFVNTRQGSMRATAVGARITGDHADRIVIDDAMDADDVYGPGLIKHVRWYDNKLKSRVRQGAALVVVMQRFHEKDLAGVLMARAKDDGSIGAEGGTDIITLPEHYNPDVKWQTCTRVGLTDWRTEQGELLFPELFDELTIKRETADMSRSQRSAQREQEPSLDDGSLFDPTWWPRFVLGSEPTHGRWIVSIDPTNWSKTADADETGVHLYLLSEGRLYLLQRWTAQYSQPEGMALFKRIRVEFPLVTMWLVEKKAGGTGIMQNMLAAGWPASQVIGVNPNHIGDKYGRADAASVPAECGRIFIPEGEDGDTFIDLATRFPNAGKDDDIDAFSQAVCHPPIMKELGGRTRAPRPPEFSVTRTEVEKRRAASASGPPTRPGLRPPPARGR